MRKRIYTRKSFNGFKEFVEWQKTHDVEIVKVVEEKGCSNLIYVHYYYFWEEK